MVVGLNTWSVVPEVKKKLQRRMGSDIAFLSNVNFGEMSQKGTKFSIVIFSVQVSPVAVQLYLAMFCNFREH